MISILILTSCNMSNPIIRSEYNSYAAMYGEAKLIKEKLRFSKKINELYTKLIRPKLMSSERRVLNNIVLSVPSEVVENTPFYFATDGENVVRLPVLSLLFLEDLCTAYAWLYLNQYSLETIDEYVTMLKYKHPSKFPERRYLNPLEALQIPENALSDKKVDALSLRLRNEAYMFILSHELGHVLFNHPSYSEVSRSEARMNEESADQFALDLMERPMSVPTEEGVTTAVIPMGAILYFQAQVYFMPNQGQLSNEELKQLTHPLTSDRLKKMAVWLDKAAERGNYGSDSNFLSYLAPRLLKIAEILEIKDLQKCMAVVADRADIFSLAPRKEGSERVSPLEKWCTGT